MPAPTNCGGSTMRRTTFGIIGILGLASVLGPVGTAAPAGAEEAVGYIATASAQGFRGTYVVPGQFVVEEIWDFGGPVAQGQVDTSGGSSYASLPFPGAAFLVAPGLVLNLAGLSQVPVAAYPFYVSASYPATPSATTGDPSGHYGLKATAGQAGSHAHAFGQGGPDAGHLFRGDARTDISQAGDVVTAQADAVMEGLSLGDGVLTIGSAVARSTTVMNPGQPLVRTAKLEVNGLKVAGTPVGLGPNGVDDDALNAVLSQAGLTIRIAHQDQSATNATADVLEITLSHPLLDGTAKGVMRYQFGGATTGVLSGALADAPAATGSGTESADTNTADAAMAGTASPAVSPPLTAAPPTASPGPRRRPASSGGPYRRQLRSRTSASDGPPPSAMVLTTLRTPCPPH